MTEPPKATGHDGKPSKQFSAADRVKIIKVEEPGDLDTVVGDESSLGCWTTGSPLWRCR